MEVVNNGLDDVVVVSKWPVAVKCDVQHALPALPAVVSIALESLELHVWHGWINLPFEGSIWRLLLVLALGAVAEFPPAVSVRALKVIVDPYMGSLSLGRAEESYARWVCAF